MTTIEQFIYDKQLHIAQIVVDSTLEMIKLMSTAYPSKRINHKDKYLRAPLKRKTKQAATTQIEVVKVMAAMQINIIQSQPFPRR